MQNSRIVPDTAEAARTSYRYDAEGRVATITRPRHQGTELARQMHWDGYGRLSRVVDELGHETHMTWTARDQLATVHEGPLGGDDTLVSVYRYTDLGHLTAHRQRLGPEGPALVTEWLDHTPEGLVGRIRTARGEETLTWDALGRPRVSEVSARVALEGVRWRPQRREWTYDDEAGRVELVETSHDSEGAGVVTDVTRQVFDERGWLRVEEVERPEGTLVVEFDYDASGNRTLQRTSGAGGSAEQTRWTWDARNRLSSLQTPEGTSHWHYSPGGRAERIELGNGTQTRFGYTADARRLASVVHRAGVSESADVLAAAHYTYDIGGNRASQVLTIAGVTETTTYTYDALDQLRSFSVVPGAGSPPGAERRHTWYGHDRYRRVYEGRCRGGDALAEDEAGAFGLGCAPPVEDDEGNIVEPGGIQTMDRSLVYAGLHGQLSEVLDPLAAHSAAEGAEGRVVYTHDEAGNLVERRRQVGWHVPPCAEPCSDGSNPDNHGGVCADGLAPQCPEPEPIWQRDHHHYDALNRLSAVARGPPRRETLGPAPLSERERLGTYGYNADDLRIRVRESNRNSDAWYDGLALLVERVEQGGGSAPWVNTVRYHHDVQGLHAITAHHDGLGGGRSTHFAHRDGLGSTLAVSRPGTAGAGGAGLVAASWRTDPWGVVTAENGVDHVNHSIFTGHQHDFDTGLIYMRARFYDPAMGQFLTADSWLGEAGNPPSLQRYLYAYGNPGVWWDPDGRRPMPGMARRRFGDVCRTGATTAEEDAACFWLAHSDAEARTRQEHWVPACEADLQGHATVEACVDARRAGFHGRLVHRYQWERSQRARDERAAAERQAEREERLRQQADSSLEISVGPPPSHQDGARRTSTGVVRTDVDVLDQHHGGRGILRRGIADPTRNQVDPDTPSTLSCDDARTHEEILSCGMPGDYGARDYGSALADVGEDALDEHARSMTGAELAVTGLLSLHRLGRGASQAAEASRRIRGPSVPRGMATRVNRNPDGLEATGRPMTPEQARRAVDRGEDVYVRDRATALKVGGRRSVAPEVHPRQDEIRFPHVHRPDRRGGHIFFGEGM